MKKTIITIVVLFVSLAASAQNQSTWLHHGNYPLCQCDDIIEISDGNLAIREAVFDENLEDIGYNLYKITPDGTLLDSLFIKNNSIFALSPFLRDPTNTNNNVLTSFYSVDNVNYYKATYFNDNLEITDEIVAEYYDNCNVPTRFFVDSHNDIICRSKIGNNSYCLVRMGLDGTMKAQSNPISLVSATLVQHPVFEISAEPLVYGYMTVFDNKIVFDVYDADFNCLTTKTVSKIQEWSVYIGAPPYQNAYGTGDGGFVTTVYCVKYNGSQSIHQLMAVKFNSDIEVEGICNLGKEFLSGYNFPRYSYVNKNLCVTDNHIYVAWQEEKERWEKLSVQTLFVTCMDMDMNIIWEETSLSVLDNDMIVNYGMVGLSNGGLAISGWLTDETGYYSSKDIYAVVFDNYLATEEPVTTEKPFFCYPNPASDYIRVELSPDANCELIEIHSVDGRIVETRHGMSLQTPIDISNLNPGVYMLKLRMSDGSEFFERIVKQ